MCNFSKLKGYSKLPDEYSAVHYWLEQRPVKSKYFITISKNPVGGVIAGSVAAEVVNRYQLPSCSTGEHFDIKQDACVSDYAPAPPTPPGPNPAPAPPAPPTPPVTPYGTS
ncbi:MAG: hypothetical protein LBP35_01355 [Candidatus Ancillula trichonymphae]|nr:hypothetical protein [Candidatus Ancillula trichonymphae]